MPFDRTRFDAAVRGADRFLNAWHGGPTTAERMRAIADLTEESERRDVYGAGTRIERFERRIAELLGKEAAVFLPSGTMAQLIAVRIWCDRRGCNTVAFHPTCHLELHEEDAYARLHGLERRLVGDPNAVVSLDDLERLREPVAVLLLELPQRELGGRLPAWRELVAQTAWARERGIALHLDGAPEPHDVAPLAAARDPRRRGDARARAVRGAGAVRRGGRPSMRPAPDATPAQVSGTRPTPFALPV